MTQIQATSMDGIMGTPMQQVWTPAINSDFGSVQQKQYYRSPPQIPIQQKIEKFTVPEIQ